MADDIHKPDDSGYNNGDDNSDPRPLGQDEIDGLFAQMAGDVAGADADVNVDVPDEAPREVTAKTDESVDADTAAPTADGLGQSEIDALLAEMDSEEDVANAIEHAVDKVETKTEVEKNTVKSAPSEATSSQPSVAAAASENLGQADIDALFAEMNADDSAEPTEPEASSEQSSDPAARKDTLDQSDIDALLGELNSAVAAAEPEAAATLVSESSSPLGQDDIDNLLAELGEDEAPTSTVESAVAADAGQDEIDKLLAEMSGESAAEPVSADTSRLNTAQIAGIVKSQSESTAGTQAQLDSDDAEIMIDQDDIDALLREMSQATGAPAQEEIDEQLDDNKEDIEALLAEASSPMAASDAVKGSIAFGGMPDSRSMGSMHSAAVMAPDELRGTKYLLVAAVFLLGMCAVTMGFVVSAINGLSQELEQNRVSEIKPLDDFQENMQFAQKMLSSDEELEVLQGVKFVTQLKENYDKDSEKIIAISLLMAKHYRSKGAYSKAEKEYKTMTERSGVLYEQPQYYLDYADTLFSIGEQHYDDAINIVYRLLANEDYYLESSPSKSRSAEDITANKNIIQEAYLMLGRIYTAQLDLGVNINTNSGRGGI